MSVDFESSMVITYDFTLWKIKMEVLLIDKGLCIVIVGRLISISEE